VAETFRSGSADPIGYKSPGEKLGVHEHIVALFRRQETAFGDIDWNEFRRTAKWSPKWTVPRSFAS